MLEERAAAAAAAAGLLDLDLQAVGATAATCRNAGDAVDAGTGDVAECQRRLCHSSWISNDTASATNCDATAAGRACSRALRADCRPVAWGLPRCPRGGAGACDYESCLLLLELAWASGSEVASYPRAHSGAAESPSESPPEGSAPWLAKRANPAPCACAHKDPAERERPALEGLLLLLAGSRGG